MTGRKCTSVARVGEVEGSRDGRRRKRVAPAGGCVGSKATQFEQIAEFLHYKKSLPFKSAGVHNFMHNKFAVVDDTVITGSFNFSTNAQRNAENVVIVESADLADAFADYANALIAKYPDTGID
jgi:phosphatidylserine/phosphatidylglycerophosphate/cardiolipin synthase-like enzyme